MSDLKLKTTFILLVFSLLWNLNNCGVIGEAESVKDDRSGWKSLWESPRRHRMNQYHPQSFDDDTADVETIYAFTEYDDVEFDDIEYPKTVDYYDVERNSINQKAITFYDYKKIWTAPPELNFFTLNDDQRRALSNWEVTLKPITLRYPVRRDRSFRMEIFIPVVIIAVLLSICKYTMRKRRSTENTPETPSMIIITARTRSPALEEETPVSSVSSTTHVASGNTSNSNGETDKPPDYSTIVMADFTKRLDTVPKSPPPKYEEIMGNKQ